jgi:hypothetical protein
MKTAKRGVRIVKYLAEGNGWRNVFNYDTNTEE